MSELEVEGLGRLNVKVVGGEGGFSVRLTGYRLVPELSVEGVWLGDRRAIVDVRPSRVEVRECEYGVIDVDVEGEGATVVALIYDRSSRAGEVLRRALRLVEERLRGMGVKVVRLLKGTFREPPEGYEDRGLYYERLL